MIDPRLNVLQGYKTSYIVNAKTVSGDSVLKLDRDRDGQVAAQEPALVMKDSSQPEGWRPVKSVAELSQFLEATPAKQRATDLGLWRDARRFLVVPADGRLQKSEVTPMGGHPVDKTWSLRGGTAKIPHAESVWSAEKFHSISETMHDDYDVPEYTSYHYVKTDPARVHVATEETPAGTVSTFNESQVITHTHVEQVTCFARDGQHWVPMGFKDTDYRGAFD